MRPVVMETWEALAALVAQVGPVVPVWTAARLGGPSQQALRDRISRGTLRTWSVDGCIYVALLESLRKEVPLSTGQVAERVCCA